MHYGRIALYKGAVPMDACMDACMDGCMDGGHERREGGIWGVVFICPWKVGGVKGRGRGNIN